MQNSDIAAAEEDTQRNKYLTFVIGEENFAISIKFVIEITKIMQITPLPETPDYVKGVISMRGTIIPVIDVRLRLGRDTADYTDRTCIIVTEIANKPAGLIVDTVSEVAEIAENMIEPPPNFINSGKRRYLTGIGKTDGGLCLILDCEKLLSEEEITEISTAMATSAKGLN